MVRLAQKTCDGLNNCTFHLGEVTNLPYKDSEFDVVVSTQVFEYVKDIGKALSEMFRVLKPNGRGLILDTDFESVVLHSSDHERTKRVLLAYDEHLHDPHLPRKLVPLLKVTGFQQVSASVWPMLFTETMEGRFASSLVDYIVNFIAGKKVTEEEAKAWKEDLVTLSKCGEFFMSFNRYIFVARKICPGNPVFFAEQPPFG